MTALLETKSQGEKEYTLWHQTPIHKGKQALNQALVTSGSSDAWATVYTYPGAQAEPSSAALEISGSPALNRDVFGTVTSAFTATADAFYGSGNLPEVARVLLRSVTLEPAELHPQQVAQAKQAWWNHIKPRHAVFLTIAAFIVLSAIGDLVARILLGTSLFPFAADLIMLLGGIGLSLEVVMLLVE